MEEEINSNSSFRKVLYTSKHSQIVVMKLKPHEEIGMEIHPGNDQIFCFKKGQGRCVIDGAFYEIKEGSFVVVPSASEHNIVNTSDTEELDFYTIYAPAHHPDNLVQAKKEDDLSFEKNGEKSA